MRLLAALVLAACVASSGAHADGKQPIETFTLKNGMLVVVLPNHRVAAVNHMLWFKVGAADDPPGKSGLAHYHEHLMFKGSPQFASGEYVRLLSKNGGEHNAFTGRDTTSYFVTIAKDRLPLVMRLEADRMRGLTVSSEEAEKEKQVIIEERRQRIDNLPDSLLDEQMNAALFRNHPYHNPIIGWPQEMDNLARQDALDFHARYYHPGNAILIVSGDITAKELKPLAEKYYGALPAKKVPPRRWLAEPPQIAPRTVTLAHANVKQPAFSRTYMAPNRQLPLSLLSHVLGGGKNSVLYRALVVERKLAAEVDVSYNLYTHGPSEFSVSIVPENGVALPAIEKALDEELSAFLKSGIEPAMMERTKRLMQAEEIYAREGLTSLSNIMGWMLMSGMQPDDFNRWSAMVEAVSAEQVMQAARAVLVPEASVTGYLLPKEGAP